MNKKIFFVGIIVILISFTLVTSPVKASTLEDLQNTLIQMLQTLIAKLTEELNTLLILKQANQLITTQTSTSTENILNIKINTNTQTTGQCTMQSANFTCDAVSQGSAYNPDYPPMRVCGCKPLSCPANKPYITVNATNEKWPDGTTKGSFICDESLPS